MSWQFNSHASHKLHKLQFSEQAPCHMPVTLWCLTVLSDIAWWTSMNAFEGSVTVDQITTTHWIRLLVQRSGNCQIVHVEIIVSGSSWTLIFKTYEFFRNLRGWERRWVWSEVFLSDLSAFGTLHWIHNPWLGPPEFSQCGTLLGSRRGGTLALLSFCSLRIFDRGELCSSHVKKLYPVVLGNQDSCCNVLHHGI